LKEGFGRCSGRIISRLLKMRLVTLSGCRPMLLAESALVLAIVVVLFVFAAGPVGGLTATVIAIVGLSHVMGTNGLTRSIQVHAGAASATFAAAIIALAIYPDQRLLIQ
jgi:hypothetical protein